MAKAKPLKRSTSTTRSAPIPVHDLRRNLSTIGLWALGVINAALIFSMISKHFLTGNERMISSVDEVPELSSQPLKVEVLNGCGVQGLARKWADVLHNAGFDPVNVTNFESDNIPRTMILDRLSNARKNGMAVAEALGLPDDFVSYQTSEQRMVAVSVIIGKDYDRLNIAQK